MEFHFRRSYRGPLQAVIFDWAGTMVDHGSRAPVAVFVELFKRRGVTVSPEQARGPMGLEKKDHIRAVAALAPVAAQWRAHYGRDWDEDDVEALFQESVPLQAECVADFAELIPGAAATLAGCRARGLKIGATTGYSRPIMEVLLPAAAQHGYIPDSNVCPSDVPAGRPAPWMAFQNAINLGVYPMTALVKVGDTVPDVEEGLNAGMWTVAVTHTGNELGLSADNVAALDRQDLAARLAPIRRRLRAAGVHYLIDSVADLLPVLDQIEERLRRGEQP